MDSKLYLNLEGTVEMLKILFDSQEEKIFNLIQKVDELEKQIIELKNK